MSEYSFGIYMKYYFVLFITENLNEGLKVV
ncbi:hypothetical protein DJ87_3341 [Bacillus cereus]|uniref:Uncharacterized protein n=1 Tax=Bacillus paranthracis TaxID=2026186 RepID=A0A7D8HC54_9BACI|nr:hypothetical protein IAU_02157 [Bacillus cereus IS075]EJQ11227.1 hypothetical protein IC5_00472 [Bacillus cereus AND1407]EJR12666.1 hypothetical protein II7_02871 [Bacillus cereus MSX-A12]EJR13385.1 hypothetical protein II9_04068 [Bacillus cereus MSX-D12]EOO85500.1 hypothetical protein IGS_04672 [Bacillus cereus IS845/00]EOO94294.1 hypothetical protein IGQ_04809 [Bacillus cereus IS195]KFK72236.1 hypothetical protein DJ87_3341 [Bacillus cereus]TDT85238.1 hypothetical protein DEU41_2725 [Ba